MTANVAGHGTRHSRGSAASGGHPPVADWPVFASRVQSKATNRGLLLRRWRESDLKPFAKLNADPSVMEFYVATLTQTDSDAFVDRIEAHFDETGFGLWAVELVSSREFAGYVGLWPATFESHFTPAIEVGWRLARRFWGAGLAPKAAQAAVDDGFQRLDVDEIVSFTSAINLNSRRVMEKLGMRHKPTDEFDRPSVAVSDPLRLHVLYRLAAPQATR